MRKIPIHLLINDFNSLVNEKSGLIKNIDPNSIQYVWFPVSDLDDLREARIISEFLIPATVWYVKNPDILPDVVNERDLNLAFPFNTLLTSEPLTQHKLLFMKYRPIIHILDEGSLIDVYDRIKLLNIAENILNYFRSCGVSKIHFSFNHSDTGVLIEVYKKLKSNIESSYMVVFDRFKNREQVVLKNSLLLGNLFYEKTVDSILISYDDMDSYKDFIKEDINLIKTILNSLGIVKIGYTIISCPKCGRCQMDLLKINRKVDEYLNKLEADYNKKGIKLEDFGGITVAVMGCNVNGPGEARSADIGIAGGKNGKGTIFKYGIPFVTLSEDKVVDRFLHHVKKLIDKKLEKSGLKAS